MGSRATLKSRPKAHLPLIMVIKKSPKKWGGKKCWLIHWKTLHHFPITFFRNALESVNGEMWEGKTGVRERTFNFAEQLFPFLCDFNSLFNAFSICTMEAVNWEKGEGAHGTQEGGKKGLFNFFADSLSSLRDAPNILLHERKLWCKIWNEE